MTILSPDQIAEVLKIVDKYTLTFLAQSVGQDILSKDEKDTLKKYGIDLSKIDSHSSNVTQAFKFGLLSDAMGHAASQKYTYDQFKESLKSGSFIPLNKQETSMLRALQYNTYADVKKLGGNVKNDIASGIVEVDRKGMVKAGRVVRDAVAESIEKRKGVNEIVSIIGNKTGQWNRDLLRIANYNLHEAFNQGRVANIERKGTEGRIYFDVFPGSCKHCIRLYLTAGFGSAPKVFKIDEIRSNGTNIGKKVTDWLPTISPVHPSCRCTANEVPDGYEWDEKTRSFTKPNKEFKRKVERKSKIGITVTRDGKSTKSEI